MTKKKRRPMNYWTQVRVIAAMRRWERENGKMPSNNDWKNSGSYWPAQTTVFRVFPSWRAAVAAASEKPKLKVTYGSQNAQANDPYDTLMKRLSVMEMNLNRQMGELRMMLDKVSDPVKPESNGHSTHEPNLIARLLGKAA